MSVRLFDFVLLVLCICICFFSTERLASRGRNILLGELVSCSRTDFSDMWKNMSFMFSISKGFKQIGPWPSLNTGKPLKIYCHFLRMLRAFKTCSVVAVVAVSSLRNEPGTQSYMG